MKTWFKRVLRKVSRLDQICLKFLILRGIPYASSGIRCHKFQKDLKRAKLMFSTFLVRIYVKSKVRKSFSKIFEFSRQEFNFDKRSICDLLVHQLLCNRAEPVYGEDAGACLVTADLLFHQNMSFIISNSIRRSLLKIRRSSPKLIRSTSSK